MTQEERDRLFYASNNMKGKINDKKTQKRLKEAQAGMTSEKLQRKYRKQWYHRSIGYILFSWIIDLLHDLIYGSGDNK